MPPRRRGGRDAQDRAQLALRPHPGPRPLAHSTPSAKRVRTTPGIISRRRSRGSRHGLLGATRRALDLLERLRERQEFGTGLVQVVMLAKRLGHRVRVIPDSPTSGLARAPPRLVARGVPRTTRPSSLRTHHARGPRALILEFRVRALRSPAQSDRGHYSRAPRGSKEESIDMSVAQVSPGSLLRVDLPRSQPEPPARPRRRPGSSTASAKPSRPFTAARGPSMPNRTRFATRSRPT